MDEKSLRGLREPLKVTFHDRCLHITDRSEAVVANNVVSKNPASGIVFPADGATPTDHFEMLVEILFKAFRANARFPDLFQDVRRGFIWREGIHVGGFRAGGVFAYRGIFLH